MTFTGIMEDGRLLFLDPTGGKCDVCHKNAGANIDLGPAAGLVNFNFDTGVEQFAHPSDEEGADGPVRVLPCDDGFGRTPAGNGCFGDGRFNTPSLVEAADTPPFFHNNAVGTIEEAVAFYVSDAFNDSESGEILQDLGGGLERAIVLSDAEILAVAAFLRGINALENIRSSIAFGQRAQRQAGLAPARALLQLSLADIRDAIKVLQDASLHPEAVIQLLLAQDLIQQASAASTPARRNALIEQAITRQGLARSELVL